MKSPGSHFFRNRERRLANGHVAAALCLLVAVSPSAAAGPRIEREPFESLEYIAAGGAGRAELSSEFVREGKHSLRFTATVNPRDALVAKSPPQPVDLSGYNALSLWIRPDVADGTFALDVRLVVWDDAKRRGVWRTIGHINHQTAPNRKWSRHCFFLGDLKRTKVMRLFDIVAWHHVPAHHKGESLTFYLDEFRFLNVPLARRGLILNGGFEQALIPWRIENAWRAGQVRLDSDARQAGRSSLRVSSPQGKASRTVSQSVPVDGGAWYRCSLWVRTEEAEGAEALLSWGRANPREFVMKTYRNVKQRLCRVSGTTRFVHTSRLMKAPEAAERLSLTLGTSGGTAWFDEISIEKAKFGGDELDWLSMPPKRTLLWRPKLKLPASLTFPSISAFRIALEPKEGSPFVLQLAGLGGTRIPLIQFDGKVVSARAGGVWKSLPGVFRPRSSMVIYVNLGARAFALNFCGIVLPWWGPFDLEGPSEQSDGLLLGGEGVVRRLLVEGPLWTPDEIRRRQDGERRLRLTLQKGVGWTVRREELPDDLRVDAPLSASAWATRAVILHTGMRFSLLAENLERIKGMGFNTLCLRPPQPSGRIGSGSGCCVQDYDSVDPGKGGVGALKALVAKAHRLGMRVIFWLVPNHSAASNPTLYVRPELYFTDAGIFRSAWFDVVDFDYGNPETWRFFAGVGARWVREFDVDGFGVDVPDLLPRPFFRYFKREIQRAKGGDMFVVGESSGANVHEWGMDCRYGFLSAFQMQEILVGVRPPSKPPQPVIAKLIGRLYPHETLETFGPFGGNWGLTRWIDRFGPDRAKCTAVVMATLPFAPEVLAGPEILAEHSESDPYGFVAKMLRLRERHPSLRATSVEMVDHDKPALACAYWKRAREEWALVVINFAPQPTSLTLSLPAELATAFRKSTPVDLITGDSPKLRWRDDSHVVLRTPACAAAILRIEGR